MKTAMLATFTSDVVVVVLEKKSPFFLASAHKKGDKKRWT